MYPLNGLVLHLYVIEQWHGKHSYRGSHEGMRGPCPTQELSSPGFQSREEEFLQNMTVKIGGDSGHLGEIKGS